METERGRKGGRKEKEEEEEGLEEERRGGERDKKRLRWRETKREKDTQKEREKERRRKGGRERNTLSCTPADLCSCSSCPTAPASLLHLESVMPWLWAKPLLPAGGIKSWERQFSHK